MKNQGDHLTWPHYTRALACVFLQVNVRRLTQEASSSDLPTRMCTCGGVLYESLVQSLAVDGINLSKTVVQRGIRSDVVHLDCDSVCIQTPRREKKDRDHIPRHLSSRINGAGSDASNPRAGFKGAYHN